MTEPLQLRETEMHWRRVRDEVVVLDGSRSRYLSLNRAGADLWTLLADGTDKASLVACLVEAYGVDAEQATADVEAFVADLRARSLLR